MTLSILIPAYSKKVDQLLALLLPQLEPFEKEVEILLDKGKDTIGVKLNNLLADSYGKYVWMLQESCLVSETAISDVMNAVQSEPDVVGINGAARIGDSKILWVIGLNEGRKPDYISPMKKEIALMIPFRKKSLKSLEKWANDMNRIAPWVTECVIEKPILLL